MTGHDEAKVGPRPHHPLDARMAALLLKSPETTIIVPAYNEEEGLPVVLRKLCGAADESFEILVVDDGSTDRTQEVARGFLCRVISHAQNQGKGEAMKTGIKHARGKNVIFIDADDTYPAELVCEMAKALESYDMVVGSRVSGKDNIPAFNRIGNAIFRNSIRYLYGFKAYDPLTGLYGIRKAHLEKMQLVTGDFGIESEIAAKAATMGLKTLDIPIQYGARIGEAKLHGPKDGYRIFLAILKHVFLYSPIVGFVFPGLALLLFGLLVMIVSWSRRLVFGDPDPGLHPFAFGAMASLVGYEIAVLGLGTRLYAIGHKFTKAGLVGGLLLQNGIHRIVVALGICLGLLGFALVILYTIGPSLIIGLAPSGEAHMGLLGSFLFLFGIQMVFSGFFLSMLRGEVAKDLAQDVRSPQQSGVDM